MIKFKGYYTRIREGVVIEGLAIEENGVLYGFPRDAAASGEALVVDLLAVVNDLNLGSLEEAGFTPLYPLAGIKWEGDQS